MIRKATAALLFCAALATFGACKKDKKNESAPAITLTYKVETQNAANFTVAYKDANGAVQSQEITGESTWSLNQTVQPPFQASLKAEAVRNNSTQPVTCNISILKGNEIVAMNALTFSASNVSVEVSETVK